MHLRCYMGKHGKNSFWTPTNVLCCVTWLTYQTGIIETSLAPLLSTCKVRSKRIAPYRLDAHTVCIQKPGPKWKSWYHVQGVGIWWNFCHKSNECLAWKQIWCEANNGGDVFWHLAMDKTDNVKQCCLGPQVQTQMRIKQNSQIIISMICFRKCIYIVKLQVRQCQ